MMELLQSVLIVLNLLLVTGQEDLRPSGLKKFGNEDDLKKVIDNIIDKRTRQKFSHHKKYFQNSGDFNIRNELKTETDSIFSLINSLKRNNNVKKSNESFETSEEIKNIRKMMLNDTSSSDYHGESGHLTRRFWSGFNNFAKDMMNNLPFTKINKHKIVKNKDVNGKKVQIIEIIYPMTETERNVSNEKIEVKEYESTDVKSPPFGFWDWPWKDAYNKHNEMKTIKEKMKNLKNEIKSKTKQKPWWESSTSKETVTYYYNTDGKDLVGPIISPIYFNSSYYQNENESENESETESETESESESENESEN